MDTIVEWKETEWVLSDTSILPETTISGNLNPYLKFYRWIHEEPEKEERKEEKKPEIKVREVEGYYDSPHSNWDGVWIVLVIIGAVLAAFAPIVLAFGAVLIASMADSVCG